MSRLNYPKSGQKSNLKKPTKYDYSNSKQNNKIKQLQIYEECLNIINNQTTQQNNKWLMDNKINSYSLRNDKANQIVNSMVYIFQKVILQLNDNKKINKNQNIIFTHLFAHYKNSNKKIIQFCHLLKHFSLWDYQFQFFYTVFLGQGLSNISLYLNCRNVTIQSNVNKYKKTILSGVLAEIQQWSKLALNIFKGIDERTVVQQFVQVVKCHYLQLKKNQNQRINGAQFFKICQIMSQKLYVNNQISQQKDQRVGNTNKSLKFNNQNTVGQIFKDSLLNGLNADDRQLIRVLSFKDKNIARLLQQKHNKMVNIIGQQVDNLRKDIQIQKYKYLQVVQERKALIVFIQKIKRKTLQYIQHNNAKNQQDLLNIFHQYNKIYNTHSNDVQKTKKNIQNKRILEVIQAQQKLL